MNINLKSASGVVIPRRCDRCEKLKVGTVKVGWRWIYVPNCENQLNHKKPIRWCLPCIGEVNSQIGGPK